MYVFNELNNTLANKTLAAPSTKFVIYSQFYIEFAFYVFTFSYVTLKHSSILNIVLLVVLGLGGAAGLIISYANPVNWGLILKVCSVFSLALALMGGALLIIKKKNREIIDFLSGVLVLLLWIFLIMPFAVAIPIGAVYIPTASFGQYVYYIILSSTVLLILLVSVMSLLFNVLMNKFEVEKKVKFITEDVQSYLKDEGV